MWTYARFAALCSLGLPLVSCGDPSTQPNASPELEQSTWFLSTEVPGTWRKMPSIVPARGEMGAAVSDKSIVVVGGHGNDNLAMSRVDAYNVETRTWTPLKALPRPRYGNGATTINGRIYVAGGRSTDNPVVPAPQKTLFVYDPVTDTWTRKADVPQPVYVSMQAGLLGKLYVYRGEAGDHFWSYSPRTDRWGSLPLPPTRHISGVLTALGGKLYLISGYPQSFWDPPNAEVDVYDPATKSWSIKQPMLHAGPGMVAVTFHGKLWVAGGGIVQVYDPATDVWKYGPSMLNSSAWGSGAYAGGRFFVIGGFDDSRATSMVQAFSTAY